MPEPRSLGRAVLELAVNDDAYNLAVSEAEKKAKALETRFEKTGKRLEAFGKKSADVGKTLSTHVTAPILAVGAGLAALVAHTAATGDAIAKQAQEAGLAGQAFQELTFAMGQLADVSDERVRVGLNSLNQRLGQAAQEAGTVRDRFVDLGLSSRDLAAGSVTAEQAFDALVARLQRTRNASEASAIAAAVLGEDLGRRLGPALRASGGEVAALRQQFRDLGLGMSDEALKASERFDDELDILKRQLAAVGREIGETLLPLVLEDLVPVLREDVVPVLRDMADILGDVIDGFRDLPEPVKAAAVIIATAFAATGPAMLALGGLAKLIGPLLRSLTLLRFGWAGLAAVVVGSVAAIVQAQSLEELEGLRDRAETLRKNLALMEDPLERQMLEATEEQIRALETRLFLASERADHAALSLHGLGAAAGDATSQFGMIDPAVARFTASLRRLREDDAALAAFEAEEQAVQVLIDFYTKGAGAAEDLSDALTALHQDVAGLGNQQGLTALLVPTDEEQARINAAWQATQAALVETQLRIAESDRALQGFNVDLEATEALARRLESTGAAVGGVLGTGLERAALGAESFEEALKGVIDELIHIAFRLLVIQQLEAALGGLFAGFAGGGGTVDPAGVTAGGFAINGPMMAGGGHLGVGEAAFVGEKGIELFIPDQSGTVIPHDEVRGLGGMVVNIDARGAAPGVGPEIRRALMEVEERAVRRSVGAVVDEQRRGGAFRSTFA